MQVQAKKPHLHVVAGRPLSVQQQGEVVRNAFTLERERSEGADDSAQATEEFLMALGLVFAALLVVAVLVATVAVKAGWLS